MKNARLQLTCIAFALLSTTAAYGQDNGWYIVPSVVYGDDDDRGRVIDDAAAGGQIHIGRNVSENISLEGVFGYSDIDGFPGETHQDISLNLLAYFDRDAKFSPYILAGIGYLGVEIEGVGDDNRPSGTFGVGVKWALGGRTSIRAEYRARLAWERGDNLTDFMSTIGLQIGFGGSKPTPSPAPAPAPAPAPTPVLDSDGDGVPDGEDRCPNSVADAIVNFYGCELDDDADRVVDRLDKCPNTATGVRVDVNGCEIKDVIKLPGVNFANNSDRLLVGTEKILMDAAATLKQNPAMKIIVAGHTDSVGAAAANESLSERRAKTVQNYLIRFGADAANITARGYGESRPVSDNDTAQGRAANRRVELIILN